MLESDLKKCFKDRDSAKDELRRVKNEIDKVSNDKLELEEQNQIILNILAEDKRITKGILMEHEQHILKESEALQSDLKLRLSLLQENNHLKNKKNNELHRTVARRERIFQLHEK